MKVHIDIETFSACDLKKAGLYRYAEDFSTEIILVCYAIDDGPISAWLPEYPATDLPVDLTDEVPLYVQDAMPADLRAAIDAGATLVAHNAAFERVMLSGEPGRRLGFPVIPADRMDCTAARAAVMGLPRSLENAAEALGTFPKMAVGRMNMLQLARPRKDGSRYTLNEYPDKYLELVRYCVDDVKAEQGLDAILPPLTPTERHLWLLDQKINDRGVQIDQAAIEDVQCLVAEYKAFLEQRCHEWTGLKPTQTGELAAWVRDNGYPQLVDLQAGTVAEAVVDPACPDKVRAVLRLRSLHAMKAVTKYSSMQKAVCADGRLRGMCLFYGAATGRWSSLIVQLQNIFRPVIKDPEVAIEAFAARCLAWVRTLYAENPMRVFASAVRGMLIAATGKRLMALDFAAIEARVLAWLAGQRDVLEVFRTHGKIYEHAAAQVYRVRIEDVTPPQRFVGKVCLSGGTLVLCESGWKAIESVTTQDKVWDGEEWVCHQGLAYNGFKATLNLCGVSLTPDHLVWSGQDWHQAKSLVGFDESVMRRALACAAENLPSRAMWQALAAAFRHSSLLALAGGLNTLSRRITSRASGPLVATCVPKSKQVQQRKATGRMPRRCLTTLTGGDYSTGFLQPSVAATERAPPGSLTTADVVSLFGPSGGRIRERFSGTFSRFLAGMIPAKKRTGQTTTEGMSQATSGSPRKGKTFRTEGCSATSKEKSRVYDLLSVGSKNRFVILSAKGPLIVHNCSLALGYQGGKSAFAKMAKNFGVEIPEERAEEIKNDWRNANFMIVRLWHALEDAAVAAVSRPGQVFEVAGGKVMFKVEGEWLFMRLPSGRKLAYLRPELNDEGQVTYMGTDTFTRRWGRVKTYGGRLAENLCQSVSRDLLANGMIKLDEAGYDIVLTVHDEIVLEGDFGDKDYEKARALMCSLPSWAKGLPVGVAGWVGSRYRK